ncbi:hypothetical protein BC938DRAFT_477054 [Jimgerdemannia flammicorona]|uniref:Uncharacterized protein n=1 Tax=Jimgerdemannia flammicorona TaxID=994334 RepID=A0A433QPU7_9FUNG|nr:hypothetical protein BC938DRAFT_477054 [Jimgerdemannia flammicorona]
MRWACSLALRRLQPGKVSHCRLLPPTHRRGPWDLPCAASLPRDKFSPAHGWFSPVRPPAFARSEILETSPSYLYFLLHNIVLIVSGRVTIHLRWLRNIVLVVSEWVIWVSCLPDGRVIADSVSSFSSEISMLNLGSRVRVLVVK